jgi:tetratricopeptide (TPR) repeat protein
LKAGLIQLRYKPALIGLVAAALCSIAGLSASADAEFDKAVKAYNAKDYRGAYSTLQLVLKKTPNDVNALYYAALCCSQFRNFAGATAIYNRIVQTDPNSSAAGLARTALSSMAPAAVASTPAPSRPAASQNAVTVPIQTNNVASPGDDMSSLPDHANFYFTKESSGHMAVTVMVNGHQVPA